MEGNTKFEPDTTIVGRLKVFEASDCLNLGRYTGKCYTARGRYAVSKPAKNTI
jgi:hypothetical protein